MQQLSLNFNESATQRARKAERQRNQMTLFATWAPNIDVSLHSPTEAVATIHGSNPDQVIQWFKQLVGAVRPIKAKRLAFPVAQLHKLAFIRPPAKITLDATTQSIANVQHAHALGQKPLRVSKEGRKLVASSPRGWPTGFKITAAPWAAIEALINSDTPLVIEESAKQAVAAKLQKAGTKLAKATLSGNTILITTNRPHILETQNLPALAYVGEPGDGTYRMPLLLGEALLENKLVELDDKTTKAIKQISKPAKPLVIDDENFPWTLWGFQQEDAGTGLKILKTTGGVLFAGSMGSGKALFSQEKVETIHGPKQIRTLTPGEKVLGSDGNYYPVTGVYPQGDRPIYQIQFSDNTRTLADESHLWTTTEEETCTTAELHEKLTIGQTIYLPLPADTTTADSVLAAHLKEVLTPTSSCQDGGGSCWYKLKDLTFVNTLRLAGAVVLTRKTNVLVKLPARLHRIITPQQNCTCPPPYRKIETITYWGQADATCIQVASPDHLFVCSNGVVTHNTTVSLGVVHAMNLWPALFVGPLAAASTWARQLGEMKKDFYMVTGNPKKDWEAITQHDYEAYFVTYDRLETFSEVLKGKGLQVIVADEIQKAKNAGSRRSRALRAMSSAAPYRIGLSGTPLVGGLSDLLAQFAFLMPTEFPPRASSKLLDDRYASEEPVDGLTEHIHTSMVRRRMDQVGAKLATREDHKVYVNLTVEQQAAIKAVEEEAKRAKEDGELDGNEGRMNALVLLGKIRTIINNPKAAGVKGPNPKLTTALKFLLQCKKDNQYPVVFLQDRASFTDLANMLTAEGLTYGEINGSTPPEERIAVEKRLHAGELDGVLCSYAAAEAWSASPTSSVCLLISPTYSAAVNEQAESRVYRLNSRPEDTVRIVYLHAKNPTGEPSADDRLFEILENKKELFAKVIDRIEYENSTDISNNLSDLLFVLTGEKDEKLEATEKDQQAYADKKKKQKQHAKETIYKKKK